MTDKSLKYYCDESLKDDESVKWTYLLDYAFGNADEVEFNILDSDDELEKITSDFSDYITNKGKRKNKIYASGQFIRFKLTEKVKEFIKDKSYADWAGKNLEDISFLKNGKEFFATISHENYVILQMTEQQKTDLNNKGFNFEWDFGVDPAKENENSKSFFEILKERLKIK